MNLKVHNDPKVQRDSRMALIHRELWILLLKLGIPWLNTNGQPTDTSHLSAGKGKTEIQKIISPIKTIISYSVPELVLIFWY